MTEQERQECIAKGYLYEDTEEYLAHQAKVKDLMYEFYVQAQRSGKGSGIDVADVRLRVRKCVD